LLLVAKRDYLATVRTKAFLVGLVAAPLLFGGSIIGLALFKDKPDIKDRRVAVVDATGVAAGAVIQAAQAKNAKEMFDKTTGLQVAPRYVFEVVKADAGSESATRLALSDRVRSHELFAFFEIGADAIHPSAKDEAGRAGFYSNAGAMDFTFQWFTDPINEGLRRVRLGQLGIDQSHFEDLVAAVPVDTLSLVSRDEKTGQIQAAHKRGQLEGFLVPFALVMLLAMMVMVGASPMLSAVTEDKTQRVVEMLLGVATPFELMAGKVVGAVGVSLTSSAIYVVGGALTLLAMGMAGLVPLGILPWFYAYLVADMVMLCAMAAALGAACNTAQEAQSLAIVLLSPVIIPLCIMMPIMRQPNGVLATAVSLFPPFTPVLMLMRQAMPGGVPAWQPWVGGAGVLACTLGTAWAAARIFRVGILMQGKAPNVREILRWAWRG
jgi:ABC-2 type transport system permease protein